MTIVVTGATSFVGAGAVKELLKRGHVVYAVLRMNSGKRRLLLSEEGKRPENLVLIEEDLGRLANLPLKIPCQCDVFLHMGWRGAGSGSRKSEEIQNANVSDLPGAVHAAKALGCRRFLFTGSQAEYGIHHSLMAETAVCRPASPYGVAKLKAGSQAKELCKELDMDYGHIRIFSVYGPGDHPWSLVSDCIRTFLCGGGMELSDCTQLWNFLYIDDAGRGIADLAECPAKLMDSDGIYNLAGPVDETGPLRGFVEQIYELCGRKGSFIYGIRPANAEGTVNLIPDISKMKVTVGWEPEIRFRQGILNILRNL